MTKKSDLLNKLKAAPSDKAALDNLVAYFAQRGDFQALYEGLQEIADGIEDQGILAGFQGKLSDILRKHIDASSDPILAANLKLRLAGMLYDKAADPKEALILVTEAFEQLPSEEVAQRAVHMLKEMKMSSFVVQLLRQKAAADAGNDKHPDTLFQLGHAALTAHKVREAERAFTELARDYEAWAPKAEDGLRLVETALEELEAAVSELEQQIPEATDIERPLLKAKLGRTFLDLGQMEEGIALLEEVLDVGPTDEVFMELASAYKEQEAWEKLLTLVEQWAETVQSEEARKELLKDRVRVYALKLEDTKNGYAALEELYKRYAGVPDVVEFCVQVYSECEDYDALATLLGDARQDTRDREQERRYLEWEAALKWKKLGKLEEAERLYRRIKSIDPRNEPALLFYEEYCREKGDFRRLYSILSTRQSLVPDSQKIKILKMMAEIATDELSSPDRAIDSLKKVLVLDPNDEDAFEKLGALLEQTRRWHAVIEHYSSRVDRLPDEQMERKLELLFKVKDIYAQKDKLPVPEMVVTIYRRILQIDEHNPDAIEALGEYYRKNSRWGELTEILILKTALEKSKKKKLELHKEIARILIEYQHQEGAAIPHLEEVVRLSPKDDQALELLAKAYRGRGEFERFFEIGKKRLSVVRGKERIELLEELATIAMERLQADDVACELLEKLFAAAPKHPWALRRLSRLYDSLERFEEMADLLSRGVEKAPAAKKRDLKQKLGAVLADKLQRYDEAKALFHELLEENPNNRQARQYLQRILAQAGEFEELEEIYQGDNNIPGLLRFLDEFRQKETDLERIRAAGLEMVRIAEHLLSDKGRARQILESLLDQLPADAEIATTLLGFYPKKKADMDVARALAVIADNSEGPKAGEAAHRLAEVLEQIGEFEASYTRTLGLFLEMVREGELSLLGPLVDRAANADNLDNLAQVIEELLAEDLPGDALGTLAIQAADIYKSRLKNAEKAKEVLCAQLEREPDSLEVLRELERLYMGAGDWEQLETTVRSVADLMMDLDQKKEELHKLARLYEEIIGDSEKAGETYGEIRELDPTDEEANSGLKRILEELEKWEQLAAVLEEELQVASDEQARENLLQLAWVHDEKMDDSETASEYWRQVVKRWEDDETAWDHLERLFQADEALHIVLPLLEGRCRTREDWERLVEVLAKKAQVAEDEHERLETLGQCAQLLNENLSRPDEAFSYLTCMASMDASQQELIDQLESTGRKADKLDELFSVYKGMLGIGESDFEPQSPLDEGLEQGVALLLAGLADELGDRGIAVEALKKARMFAPSELSLFQRLEGLLEEEELWEELLELLEEKKEYVWEEDEKGVLYARVADLLTDRLEREEDSISWVEELFTLSPEAPGVADRLEELYLKYERWPELTMLLNAKLAHLEGEERRGVAYQLAVVYRDHLADLENAYQLLSEIIAQDPEDEASLEALSHILGMKDADAYDSVVLKVVAVLEPIATEREDWDKLAAILEVKAELNPEPVDAAGAWYGLGQVLRDRLEKPDGAFDAFARAVEAYPASEDYLAALLETGDQLNRNDDVVAAIAGGIGDIETTDEVPALTALASTIRQHTDDLDKAAAAYERLLELSPDTLEHYWSLDEIYELRDNPEGRIRVLTDVVERLEGRKQAEVFVTLAQLQLDQEQRSEAIDSLYRALENPDLLEDDRKMLAFHLLEEALEAEERWFDLCQTLVNRRGFTEDVDEKKALLFRAAQLEEEELDNPDKAVEHYYAIIDLEPLEATATSALYRLLEATGKYVELEDLLSTQAELSDEFEEKRHILLKLARVRLFDLSSPERTVDALTVLVEQDVFDDDVVEMLEQVVENFPDAGFRATQLLETAYRATEQFEKLAETFKTQIDRYTDEVDSVERYRELATLYEKQFGDVDTAFLYIAQAFKHEPTSQAIHDQLIRYAKDRASFDELFDIYLDVLVQLEEPDSRNNLRTKMVSIYHDELGDLEHAELIYRDMLDDEPGHTFAVERLQALYTEQENWERLVEILRMKNAAAQSDKARISTLYEIASLYRERTNDLAEALDTYEEILSLDNGQWDAYRGIESIHFERNDVQGVTASLRRELDARQSPEEKKEVRLRLAAILFTELEEYDLAVEELGAILGEHPEEESALELLDEIVDKWETPSRQVVELLVDSRTAKEDWDALIALYQKQAARASSDEERMEWFEKVYAIRTERQEDERGAFAICKIMVAFQPESLERRERLVAHAVSVGEVPDLVEFLENQLESDQVSGTGLETDFHALLGEILKAHTEDNESAAGHFELVADGDHPDLAATARTQLRELYQELESWEKYIALLEALASDAHEPEIRRNFLLEAAQVAWITLEDLERAYEILSSLAQEFPDDEATLDRFEQLLTQMEKREDLEALLRERIDRSMEMDKKATARMKLASLLLAQPERTSEGVEELLQALEENPELAPVWAMLEHLLEEDETPHEERIRIARALEERYPDDVEPEKRRSVLDIHLSLEEEPDETNRLHLELGRLLEEMGDAEVAFFHYSQSLKLYPGVADVEEKVETLAEAASLATDYKELLLEIAAVADEESLQVRYLLKAAETGLEKLDSPEEAVEIFERVLEIDSYNLTALSHLEAYYLEKEDYEKLPAILEREIGIEEDPAVRVQKTLVLARLYGTELADADKARQWWEELAHETEAKKEAWENLEQIYTQQEEWELLSDLLLEQREAVETDDDRVAVMTKLARLYEERLENTEEAFHWYQELLQLDPDLNKALNGAKRCAIELEEWEVVAEVNEKLLASATEEESASLQRELAAIYIERVGNRKKGLQYLQTLLQSSPVAPEVRELALSQIGEPDIGFQVSLTLEPVLEEEEEWEKLVHLYEVQLEGLEDIEERIPIAAKAVDILHDKLSDDEKPFEILRGLLELAPTSSPLIDKLRELAEATGSWEKFVEVMENAYGYAADTEQLVSIGTVIAETLDEKLEDLNSALDWYRKVLEESPTDANAISQTERILETLERFDELVEFYDTVALEFEGEDKIPYLLKLGFLKEGQLEDLAGAIQAYRDVITISPDNEAALARLDGMLANPILGLAAMEILEPIYRAKDDKEKLARLLTVKAGEVEGSMDRAQLLAEAASLISQQDGREQEAFETYLMALKQRQFDTATILVPVAELAEKLGKWQDLANAMEQVCTDISATELKLDLLRRLALIYLEKMTNPGLAELKLREILQFDPDNSFALNLLSQVLEMQGEHTEQIDVLEKLADLSVDVEQKSAFYHKAAELATAEEQFDRASRFLSAALKVSPDDAETMEQLANLCRLRESWKELVELLETRSNLLEPAEAVETLLEAAHVASENLGAPSRALAICRMVLDKDEENKEALIIMTEILREQGKLQELLVALEKLAELLEGDEQVGILWQLKEISLDMGDTEGAISYVQRILDAEPQNSDAIEAKIELLRGSENLYNLVATYEEQAKLAENPERKAELLYEAAVTLADEIGEPATALEKLVAIRELLPGHIKSLQKMAQIHVQQQDYERAVEVFQQLADQQEEPGRKADARRAAARIALEDLDDPTRALALANLAYQEDTMDEDAFELVNLSLERMESFEELASLLLEKVKRTTDDSARARLCKRLAILYRDGLKQEDLFLSWTEEAHKAEEDPDLVDELLAHYRDQENLERVAPLLEWKIAFLTKRKQLKEVPELLYELGTIMEKLELPDKALEAYERCMDVDGSYLPGIYNIAMLLFRTDNQEEALTHHQTLLLRINELEEPEQKVNVYLNLARIHLENGDKKRAKTYLTRLLTIDKKHKEARKLLADL